MALADFKLSQVVPRASAVVSSQANAEAIAISADHRDMVKYPSRSDKGYVTMSEHLQIMTKAAPLAVRGQWEAEQRIELGKQTMLSEDSKSKMQ
jgi:hypothetical protein